MANPVKIAPSVLSADLVKLEEDIREVERGGADWLHVDVMDGQFVPNLTFGAAMIQALKKISDLPLDVHLMVLEPERYIEPFRDAGADVFTFHQEATGHIQRHLTAVRQAGMKAGLALNPSTPLNTIEDIVEDLDLLLIMSVNPGFAAQKYIPSATAKIARARKLIDERGSSAHIEVDGGITLNTIEAAQKAGADVFVAGSAVFLADDPSAMVGELRKRCHKGVAV
ncbi:MAG: ribulose-phosphate 3-epimerase [Gemmatimonadota bacterium]|nr:ribulose-phosphate 3-epimerase [Gemmatimonadota bacterium]